MTETINGIPTSKTLSDIFNVVCNSSLDNPVKTKQLILLTGLNERQLRDAINTLRFMYGVPIGAVRGTKKNGYYLINTQDSLLETIAPIRSQAREELKLIRKLTTNYNEWKEVQQQWLLTHLTSLNTLY